MSRKAVLERTLGKKNAKRFLPTVPKTPASGTVTLELPADLLEQVVEAELSGTYRMLAQDLEDRKDGIGMPIFHADQQADIREIEHHLACLEAILIYYGSPLK